MQLKSVQLPSWVGLCRSLAGYDTRQELITREWVFPAIGCLISSLPHLLIHQLTHLVHRLEYIGIEQGRSGHLGQQVCSVEEERVVGAGDACQRRDGLAAGGRFGNEDFVRLRVGGEEDGLFHVVLGLLVKMAASAGMRGAVPAARSGFGEARALHGCAGLAYRGAVLAAIITNSSVVDLTGTAVRFAAVARLAQQLDIGYVVAAAAGMGHDMVVLQVQTAAATFAYAPVAGIDNLLGGSGYVTALGKGFRSINQ